MKSINVTDLRSAAKELSAGDSILLSGIVYTARDAAHKRLTTLISDGGELPFPLEGSCIYYAGPTPPMPGRVCGSFGPTTSCRMDAFAPLLYDLGMTATIGKGGRSNEVKEAIVRNGGLYLLAIGGAGAIAASHITSMEEIAFAELGCESVKKLVFDDFPLIVGTDAYGNDIFERNR